MSKPYKMPPPEGPSGPLIGPNIESFTVGEWCSSPDGTGPATAVAISARTTVAGLPMDIVIRIKSPQELDRTVQMLLRHKRGVWPDAP